MINILIGSLSGCQSRLRPLRPEAAVLPASCGWGGCGYARNPEPHMRHIRIDTSADACTDQVWEFVERANANQ